METVVDICSEKLIEKAGEIIKSGGLVAFPTETVYGLGANALDPEGSKKIYAAKGRPSDNPLIVHIAEFAAMDKIVRGVPDKAKLLADKFWPGPLTMVLNKTDEVPYETTGGLETVAIRMPDNEVALKLIKASGGYIAAPSANTSGRPSPTTARHVFDDMKGIIPLIIDGGQVGIGIESTIVDLTEEVPVILRPGYITKAMLEEVIGTVVVDKAIINPDSNVKPKAPGMKYKHYAPKGDMVIVSGANDAVVAKINEMIKEKEALGASCGVIATEGNICRYEAAAVINVGAANDDEAIAHNLYGAFREMDEKNVDYIFSECFSGTGLKAAIMNRLSKAAGYQIIEV